MDRKHMRSKTENTENRSAYAVPATRDGVLVNPSDIIESLPSGVVITDGDGQPIQFNQKAVNILGESLAKIRPEEWPRRFGLYLKDGKTRYPENEFPLLRALRGDYIEGEEIVKVNDHTPERSWLSVNASPLFSPTGRIDGAFMILSDITEKKQLEISRDNYEKRIEASYELSERIAKISNEPIQVLNTLVKFAAEIIGDGCFVALLNSSGDKLKILSLDHHDPIAGDILDKAIRAREYTLKGKIEEVIRSGVPLLIPSIDQLSLKQSTLPEHMKYLDKVGVTSLLAVPIKGRNKVLGTLVLIKDRNGSPHTEGDKSYLMDIAYRTGLTIDNSSLVHSLRVESSVRKITEEALELSEVRFQSIFTSTALGIKVIDLNGNILETNPAFRNILGYSEDELKGKPIAKFWHPDEAKLLIQLLDKLKENRVQSFQLEHRLISKDGSIFWFNVTFSGIKKNEHEDSLAYIVAISENITKRKHIEAEIAEMKNRLQNHIEMERLQLAQELHDGPLQDLYSSIYKIENWNDQFDLKTKEKVEIIKKDLLNIVQGLRNTAKNLRPPALTNFGLEKAIRSHAEEFCENHPELSIHLSLAQDRQTMPEDIRLILFRVYQNSLANVIRHARASEVHVRFAFDAEEAQLMIQDNGIGFEVPSSWVELVRQGHFGLAGAVERVSLLQGVFTVESTPGQGTTVRVVIPIRENMYYFDKREEGSTP